jgi:hypothetical protein
MAGTAVVGALLCYAGLFAILPVYRAFLVQYLVAFVAAWLASRHLHALPDVERPKIMNLEKIVTDTPRWITEPRLFRTYLWMSLPSSSSSRRSHPSSRSTCAAPRALGIPAS